MGGWRLNQRIGCFIACRIEGAFRTLQATIAPGYPLGLAHAFGFLHTDVGYPTDWQGSECRGNCRVEYNTKTRECSHLKEISLAICKVISRIHELTLS